VAATSESAISSVGPTPATPGILRRLAAMAYEVVLLCGVLFVATYLFLAAGQALDDAWRRPLLQVFLVVVCGSYFVWFWRHGGQTLAAKTWRMRVTSRDGGEVSRTQAVARYLYACLLVPLFGLAILWAFFDRDRQFLHDRLAGTRIVKDSGMKKPDS
jgi:uncharacterized RDD family membrane protein YckC